MLTPDPVAIRAVDAVKRLNSPYPENHDYKARHPTRLGSGSMYPVDFTDGDGDQLTNYVFIKDDKINPYFTMEEMLTDRSNGLIPSYLDIDYLRFIVTAALAVLFSLAVIGIIIWEQDNKSLQVLTGLAGLTIGYVVGQAGRPPA